MTIDYDASELVGWKSLPTLFLRWGGTIFHGTLTTPLFWIVNLIHGALVAVPIYINMERERLDGPGYEKLEWQPLDWGVSTVGMALLFFFIVFYNNNSYQRFYQLYSHCVGCGGATMEWVGLVRLSLLPDPVSRWNATRHFLAASHILYYSLYGGCTSDDEWQVIVDRFLITKHELAALKAYKGFKPFLALTWALEEAQAQVVEKTRVDDTIDADETREEMVHVQFREIAFKFRGHCGQITNLLKEPVPFPYFHLLNVMLLIQLSLTAYALATKVIWPIGVIMMAIISLVLLGMRGLAVQLSNPFGDDSVDFNLETFMSGAYNNALAYLKADGHRPSMSAMPDEAMKNPLVVNEDPLFLSLGVTEKEKMVAWAKPNSSARKRLQLSRDMGTSTGPKANSPVKRVQAGAAPAAQAASAQPLPPPEAEAGRRPSVGVTAV